MATFDTNFFEQYARITLIDLLGKQFEALVNLDRPDLQDVKSGVGIEVTRAIIEDKNVAETLEKQIAGVRTPEISDEDFDDITTYGYAYGISEKLIGQTEFNYWRTALSFKRIVESKINKVSNGFYGDFNEFGLYVFMKDNLTYSEINDIMSFINQSQKDNILKYNYLYVSYVDGLYVCDLNLDTFNDIKISRSKRRKYYHKAVRKKLKQ